MLMMIIESDINSDDAEDGGRALVVKMSGDDGVVVMKAVAIVLLPNTILSRHLCSFNPQNNP